MLKAEELKLLGKIEEIIAEAGADSYIGLTFAGVPELCKRNIELDYGNYPVLDLELERERNANMMKESAEHGKVLLGVEHERDCLRDQIEQKDAEIRKLNSLLESAEKVSDEWEKHAHEAGELYCELEKECAQKDLEIRNLKAEIVRMKLERMTEESISAIYDMMKGAEQNG
jgi:hypothetical protein